VIAIRSLSAALFDGDQDEPGGGNIGSAFTLDGFHASQHAVRRRSLRVSFQGV
jgi:hypothetical protein